ncbi:hypothetical protein SLE2022_104290 [Rubroshorea leprosula]
MALTLLLRRATSAAVPLVTRAVRPSRAVHTAISIVGKCALSRELNCRTFVPFQRFSTATAKKSSSDESLIQVLESEIVCAEEDRSAEQVDAPDGFPFEVQDTPGERTVCLTRKYQDEIINVNVDLPNALDQPEHDDEDEGEESQTSVPMVVSVSKGNGVCLEFGITASPDQISIDSLSVKKPEASEDELAYEGPDYSDLDENLQKAFEKYLEIRGITTYTTNFMLSYMKDKDNREYLQWLRELKNFVAK